MFKRQPVRLIVKDKKGEVIASWMAYPGDELTLTVPNGTIFTKVEDKR